MEPSEYMLQCGNSEQITDLQTGLWTRRVALAMSQLIILNLKLKRPTVPVSERYAYMHTTFIFIL